MDEIDYLENEDLEASERLDEPEYEVRAGAGVGVALAALGAAYEMSARDSEVLPSLTGDEASVSSYLEEI